MRRPRRCLPLLLLAALALAACSSDGDDASSATSASGAATDAPSDAATTTAGPTSDDDGVWQVGTITALSAGGFAGIVPVGEVGGHGDLGLGTFDALAGEMVIVDGTVWQVPVDGVPVEADPDLTTPFAQVTRFDVDESIELTTPQDCDGIKAAVDEVVGADTPLLAIRVRGTFGRLQTRSVPAQSAPYPPLDSIVPSQQVTFDLDDVAAQMVGFRTADALESVSPPGYHFHAVTDDHQGGGHVLDCQQVTAGVVEVDVVSDLGLDLEVAEPQEDGGAG